MKTVIDRAALSDPALTGIGRQHLGDLVVELAGAWTDQREGRLHDRRGGRRERRAGAGRKYELVFCDRVLLTLIYLRLDLPQRVLAVLFGVRQSTIARAIGEIRPLLAGRGFAAPDRPGVRLRTLADVLAYAAAEGVTLRLDATETQVNRPSAGKPGRKAFVSGKKRLNTIKTTVISDGRGRTLWCGAFRPGRQHDQTAIQTEGIDALLDHYPRARALVDAGYRGLRKRHKRQVIAPPPGSPKQDNDIRARARTRQSSHRIPVENAIGRHKQWRGLRRWTHHRHTLAESYTAVASLVSDRDATR
jgi:DDE superfamily endonuclease